MVSSSASYSLSSDKIFEKSLDAYSRIYDLPVIEHTQNISEDLRDRVLGSKNFILLTMYDLDGNVVLVPQAMARFSLPGRCFNESSIHNAIIKLSQDTIPLVKIGEIEPVAIVRNIFHNSNGEINAHRGLAFMARIRNKKQLGEDCCRGCFVPLESDMIKKLDYFSNVQVFQYVLGRLKSIKAKNLQDEEIETNEESKFRYILHNKIMKKYILTPKRRKKEEFIDILHKAVGNCDSVLDVSCGDSRLLEQLVCNNNGVSLAVGNDISWSQISLLNTAANKLFFTNHDATNLPFKNGCFDFVICANTLHHMPSAKHLSDLLSNMLRIANKKVLIVEIEDPKKTGGLSRLLNKYWYEGFLRDVGESYLSKDDFCSILKTAISDRGDISVSNFCNIMGNYMVAHIIKKDVKYE